MNDDQMINQLKEDLEEVIQMIQDTEATFETKNVASINDFVNNLFEIKNSLKNIRYRVSDIIEYYNNNEVD